MVQFVAVGGALLFERLAYLIKTKNAIIVSLVIWSGIVIYANRFLDSCAGSMVHGCRDRDRAGRFAGAFAIALLAMIPAGREAAFFGLYEVSERGTSWMGPLLFSIVIARTGSYRQALLSLIFFFVVGLIVLWITNTDKGITEASSAAISEITLISTVQDSWLICVNLN